MRIPPIAEITDGRLTLRLIDLKVTQTYGGLIEGAPCRSINDRKLQRIKERNSTRAVHLVEPPRITPPWARTSGSYGPDRFLGPMEVLPPLQCEGLFTGPATSKPVPPDFDHLTTELLIVWFQDPSPSHIHPDLVPQILAVPWNDLAQDFGIDDL